MKMTPSLTVPRYWDLDDRPTLLMGGTVEDNLFQIPDLEAHLDLLASAGGNFVRCTLSSRDPGNVWPLRDDGKHRGTSALRSHKAER